MGVHFSALGLGLKEALLFYAELNSEKLGDTGSEALDTSQFVTVYLVPYPAGVYPEYGPSTSFLPVLSNTALKLSP